MLTALGGSEAEDAVYRELIAAASLSASELARSLNLPEPEVALALTSLETRGLASRTVTSPPRFVAAPPDLAVDPLLLRRQTEISEARAELDRLARIYRSGMRARGTDELIEIVTGAEALAERLGHLQRAARVSFEGFVKPPFIAVDVDESEALGSSEVMRRAIYDQEMMSFPGLVQKLEATRQADGEARIHPALPLKLMIADRVTALVPLSRERSDRAPTAVIVHSCGLVDALVALFNKYWEASMPIRLAEDTAASPDKTLDPRILSLLVAGVTDEAMSRQLGVSLRTIGRRIQDMMRLAGAQNRAQLGWLAARKNWLD